MKTFLSRLAAAARYVRTGQLPPDPRAEDKALMWVKLAREAAFKQVANQAGAPGGAR